MESTNNVPNRARKKTKGKQKIEMKKVENEDSRMVTFSKRKSGINKKLSELVTLCGAEVAFVAFSSSGKPFTFAHPSIETVTNRFLGRNNNNDDMHPQTRRLIEATSQMRINEVVQRYSEMRAQLDAEQKRAKALENEKKDRPKGWWDVPIGQMNLEELKLTYESSKALHEKTLKIMSEMNAVATVVGDSFSSFTQVINPMALETNPFALSSKDTHPGTNSFGEFDPTNYRNANPTLMDFSIPIEAILSATPAMDYPDSAEANRSSGPPNDVFPPPTVGFGGNKKF